MAGQFAHVRSSCAIAAARWTLNDSGGDENTGGIIAVKAQPHPGPVWSTCGVATVVLSATLGTVGGVGAVLIEPGGGVGTTGSIPSNSARFGRGTDVGGVTTVVTA